jgi:hypothetical protein
MRHGKNRSLASRKREKNVSGAMLENVYQFDARQVEPFKASWETAVPRKMRLMMHAAKMAQEGGGQHAPRHREDTGERRPSKKQRMAGARLQEVPHGPAPKPGGSAVQPARKKRVKQSGQQAFDPDTDPPLPRLQMRQPPQQPEPMARKQARTEAGPSKARFGEVNAAPPELRIGGVLAKKASAQKAAAAAVDQLAHQRAAVMENYKAARSKRSQGL